MPKRVFNKIALTLRHECFPVNLLHIFRKPFSKNTSGCLLLKAGQYQKTLISTFAYFLRFGLCFYPTLFLIF